MLLASPYIANKGFRDPLKDASFFARLSFEASSESVLTPIRFRSSKLPTRSRPDVMGAWLSSAKKRTIGTSKAIAQTMCRRARESLKDPVPTCLGGQNPRAYADNREAEIHSEHSIPGQRRVTGNPLRTIADA